MLNYILIWQPAAFLVLLPLLSLFTFRRLPTRVLNLIRVLIYIMVAAAMAGISIRLPERAGTLVVLADRSRSMPDGARQEMESLIRRLEHAAPASSKLSVISFAGTSFVEKLPDSSAFAGLQTAPSEPHATDIAGAIDAALELIPSDASGRILLLSDGLHTTGNPVAASAAAAATRGVAVDYRLLSRGAADDAAVLSVDAPLRAAPGTVYTVSARLYAQSSGTAVCRIRKNGGAWISREVRLRRGVTTVSWRDKTDSPGTANYEVELVLPSGVSDPVPENNHVRRIVSIEGRKPVLLVTASPTKNLARILREAGIDVKLAEPSSAALAPEVLAGVSGVIFENVKASAFGMESLARLKELVSAGSVGFMMTGGKSSYAVGGYYRSEIEDVLPVTLEQRNEVRKGTNVVVVVLDRSGSMSMTNSKGISKMSLANTATAEVLGLLSDFDQFGVIAVDSSPHTVVKLAPVSSVRNNVNKILSIESMGGGIFTYTGLKAAFDMAEQSDVPSRHIILFADASDAEEPGGYRLLLDTAASKGITVSVVGLGTKTDCDAAFLMDVAKLGGGIAYFTDKAEELPRIFAEDTFVMVRSTFLADPVRATLRSAASALPGANKFSKVYDFNGCNLTYLRPGCDAVLVTDDEDHSPLAATGTYGLGRVVAFCAEADGRYTGPFAQDPGAAPLLTSLVTWMTASDDEGADYMVTQEIRNGSHYAALELDPARTSDPFRGTPVLTAVFCNDSGQTETRKYPLVWDGPDRLVSEVPLPGGNVVLGSIQWDNARPHSLVPVELPYSPEFTPNRTSGRELAETLRACGGRERIAVEDIWKDIPKRLRAFPLTPIFCLAAILLFLLEIAERRFLLIGRFFAVKKKEVNAEGKDSASDAGVKSAVKLPRKRGKMPRPASKKAPAQTAAEGSAQDKQETEPAGEPLPADSISAALKKARRK
ncbi:MAG: VWA domain-containing protein [Lentisphaeria bacterium]|nr:VWA domain-containing protein [Lentisphaeria bacterium]